MSLQCKPLLTITVLLCGLFFGALGQSAPLKVCEIRLYGNKITDDDIIHRYLGVDSGEVFDSVSTIDAQKRLFDTGLFSSARVFSQVVPKGVRLLVIVEERLYLSINDIGGELYSQLHGDDHNWWKARFGLTFENFRGQMEKLSAHVTFWTSRSLSLSWYKPFHNSPYFVKTGLSLSYKPYTQNAYNRFSILHYATVGRKLGSHSKIYSSLIPGWYRDYTAGNQNSMRPEISTEPFYELLLTLGFSNDHRDHPFNTHTGSYFWTSVLTNYPYSSMPENKYVQLSTENRLFHRGIRPTHTVAYRLLTTLRNQDAGLYNNLYAGGETSLRGYPSNFVGSGVGANNRILISGEYRFPLFKTPKIDLFMLERFDSRLKGFYYQVDAALLVDYAYLWQDIEHPRAPSAFEDGAGAGLGVRVLAPTLQRSVSFDVAWPIVTSKLEKAYKEGEFKWWQPIWHLYLDLPF